MKGMRLFLCYTGDELPMVLPVNRGKPTEGGRDDWFTLLGEVTEVLPQGIWFRVEKMWSGETEMHGPSLSDPSEYFIQWSALRRPIKAKEQGGDELPGYYL